MSSEDLSSIVNSSQDEKIKVFTLSNGQKMPIIGFGTWPTETEEEKSNFRQCLNSALSIGCRHIDTSVMDMQEEVIGEIVQQWIKNKKFSREDIFITTKLPMKANRAEAVTEALTLSLKKLKLSYVDLYLIEAPFGVVDGNEFLPKNSAGLIKLDYSTNHIAVWQAMEKEVDKKRVKSIGLSNFNAKQIKRILDVARYPPVNLQIEYHIYFQQSPLLSFCKANQIQVSSFSSLGTDFGYAKHRNEPTLIQDCFVKKLSEKYNKLPEQIVLKYILQNEVAVIPKIKTDKDINLYFKISDFKLKDADMAVLKNLDKGEKGRVFVFHEHFPGSDKHPEYPVAVETDPHSIQHPPGVKRPVSKN